MIPGQQISTAAVSNTILRRLGFLLMGEYVKRITPYWWSNGNSELKVKQESYIESLKT